VADAEVAVDLDGLLATARAAGVAILDIYAKGSEAGAAVAKGDGSPLTAADLAADLVIATGLAELNPAIPVLSEETSDVIAADTRMAWPRFWCVDPLDGTKEFLARTGEFTVNIALIEHGVPVLGVVHAPALRRTWWGGSMLGGAWVDGLPARTAAHDPAAVWRVVASRSHAGAPTEAWLAALGAHKRLAMGSSLKICLVATGEADLYPRLGPTMAWDTAAAHAVLAGAGGRLCDSDGRELRYDRRDLKNPWFLAIPAEVDPTVLPRWNEAAD